MTGDRAKQPCAMKIRYRRVVTEPAIAIDVLPAGYGDSLLIECPVEGGTWRLLIDTGPDECWPALKDRLSRIAPNRQGKRHIDLAVISHIDHDHIGGASLLFSDTTLNLSFGDVWFNAPPRPATRGVAEGQALASLIGAGDVRLPWNEAFHGRAVVTASDIPFVEIPSAPGLPRITLLSPGPAQLARLFKVWDRELAKLRRKESDKPAAAVRATRGNITLDPVALAARKSAVDRATANGSSIAFLLEHKSASVLLAADAFATVLAPALKALARHRKIPEPMKLDAFKLSHHASRANITKDLLDRVQARHYVVSTNGAFFGHPNDEAIAKVVVYGGAAPRVWFNFDNDRSRRWSDPALQARHGFLAILPKPGRSGLTLQLTGASE